mmetsp:Transcript_80064/g.232459  ORF Transcript_80064/g.232459 Transcript_80064/m.232459 type:complete len:269 (-) Transcript_80064:284-1090(-)
MVRRAGQPHHAGGQGAHPSHYEFHRARADRRHPLRLPRGPCGRHKLRRANDRLRLEVGQQRGGLLRDCGPHLPGRGRPDLEPLRRRHAGKVLCLLVQPLVDRDQHKLADLHIGARSFPPCGTAGCHLLAELHEGASPKRPTPQRSEFPVLRAGRGADGLGVPGCGGGRRPPIHLHALALYLPRFPGHVRGPHLRLADQAHVPSDLRAVRRPRSGDHYHRLGRRVDRPRSHDDHSGHDDNSDHDGRRRCGGRDRNRRLLPAGGRRANHH